VLDAGATQLTFMTAGLPFLYLLFLYRAALQGLGNTLLPMISGIVEMVIRVISVLVLVPMVGELGIFLSDPLAWPFATVLLVISYYVVFKRVTEKLNAI